LRGNCEGSPRNRGPSMMNSHVALECTASECCFVNISLLPLFARDTISEQKIARDNLKNTVHVTSVQSCNLHHPILPQPPTLPPFLRMIRLFLRTRSAGQNVRSSTQYVYYSSVVVVPASALPSLTPSSVDHCAHGAKLKQRCNAQVDRTRASGKPNPAYVAFKASDPFRSGM